MENKGYVKLHRRFLNSAVRRLKPSAVCTFIDFLLMADYKSGEIRTTYRDLAGCLTVSNQNSIKQVLDCLERAGAIKTQRKPCLIIKIVNWKKYQAADKKEPGETAEKLWKTATKSGAPATESVAGSATKNVAVCYEKCSGDNNKVPVSMYSLKNKEYFLCKSWSTQIDFQNPKTDLEKLALYYLQGTNHPGLKKPNKNEILNAAVRMDIPHFETILANCRDLEQAKACVARYVRRAKGLYSLYYLACQINSIRQEVESEELKNGKFLWPGQRHAEQL